MGITASFALGEGLKAKFFYGSLVGGLFSFIFGKMSEYNPQSKFAEHLKRFGEELSSDSNLSLNFYENEKNYSSPKTNYIDYETSKKEFCKVHNDNNYNFDNYYNKNSRFMAKQTKSFAHQDYSSSVEKYNFKGKSNTFVNNYDANNYTSNYDTYNYTKDYDGL